MRHGLSENRRDSRRKPPHAGTVRLSISPRITHPPGRAVRENVRAPLEARRTGSRPIARSILPQLGSFQILIDVLSSGLPALCNRDPAAPPFIIPVSGKNPKKDTLWKG